MFASLSGVSGQAKLTSVATTLYLTDRRDHSASLSFPSYRIYILANFSTKVR